MKKLRIGVSACLIGFKYRYDGLGKFDPAVVDSLRGKVDFIPVCPEVECGLEIPRPKMRLEASPRGIRIIVIDTGEDVTDRMREWANVKLEQIEKLNIAAFIFKSKSPSCGLANVPVFSRQGRQLPVSRAGIFAALLKEKFPEMILCQETDFPGIAERLVL